MVPSLTIVCVCVCVCGFFLLFSWGSESIRLITGKATPSYFCCMGLSFQDTYF